MSVAAQIAERLGEARLVEDASGIHGVVRSGDAFCAVRLRMLPVAEVFVQLPPLDGFELAIRWGHRRGDAEIGEPSFDDRFGLATNDPVLLSQWLDAPARAALIASAYAYHEPRLADDLDDRPIVPNTLRTWSYELAGDTLAATKGTTEYDPARLAIAIETACVIASRAHRWAATYRALAPALDATARSELAIGGAPILTATRGTVELAVQLYRRRPGDPDRLRTRIEALRVVGTSEPFSLVDRRVARGQRPSVPDADKADSELADYQLRGPATRLDDATRGLVVVARPAAVAVDAGRVELIYDGAIDDRARLDAGLALVARWAIDRAPLAGPYR